VERAALGIAPIADRHTFEYLLRARLEAGVRTKLDWFIPMVGLGSSVLGLSPAVHDWLGLGLRLSHTL